MKGVKNLDRDTMLSTNNVAEYFKCLWTLSIRP